MKADVLIIEDDVICITKYFYLLELYVEKYKTPIINDVIACTKAESVHFVLDNLAHPNNSNTKPKLIILDFDLQEKRDSSESIKEIVKRIERLMWEMEYLAVSGFKGKEGIYKPFEEKLRNNHHRTYEKSRLDDHTLMLDNLEFLLNRTENKNPKSKLDAEYQKRKEAYIRLESRVGKQRLESAIDFLNNLEQGIRKSCGKMDKLNADIHKIPTMAGDNTYNRATLTQQLKARAEIINELLLLSHYAPHVLNRWEFFEYQVCHHRFYKNLKCPQNFSLKKKSTSN